jgi:DNA repair photolyase
MHNCAYCYAPCVLRVSRQDWGNVVSVKKNIPLVLSKELKTKKHGVVGISTVTDPYQPVEKIYQCSRLCLEQLLRYDFPAHVQTKSALVTRDLDLLSRFSDAQVMFSIGTLHEDERKILEPGSSPIQARLAALKQCSEAGVRTAVFFGPMYPTITLGELSSFLDTIKDAGAQELWVDMLRLRPGIWENIQKILHNNQDLLQVFTSYVRKEKKDYGVMRDELLKRANERNLKLIDAF